MSAIHHGFGEALRAEEGSLYSAMHRADQTGRIRAKWITKDFGRRPSRAKGSLPPRNPAGKK